MTGLFSDKIMSFMKKVIIILIFLLFCNFSSCVSNKAEENENIELKINIDKPIYDNSVLNIDYKWNLKASNSLHDGDTKVFVHLYNIDQKRMLLQDDHYLKELEYTRRLFIPFFIKNVDRDLKGEERIRISIGLYDKGDLNLLLYRQVFTFGTYPYYYPRIEYKRGWYDEEVFGEGIEESWRWSMDEAELVIDNYGYDMELHIMGGIIKEILPDQNISIYLQDHLLDEFNPEADYFHKVYAIPQEMIKDNLVFNIQFIADRTFVPGESGMDSSDDRKLAFKLYHIAVLPDF